MTSPCPALPKKLPNPTREARPANRDNNVPRSAPPAEACERRSVVPYFNHMRIFLFSQSILLPIIAGLIRLRRIDKTYQPFFLLLLIGFLTELVSFVLIKKFHRSNAIPLNLYTLIEWALIFLQFHVWGLLRHRKPLFYGILAFTILGWVAANFFFGQSITGFSP